MRRTLVLVALLLWPISSRADPSTSDASETTVRDARERFRRGVDLYKEGSYDAALAEFTKAYELAPNYRVLYNLAQTQAERHDYVAALKLFDEYLKQGGEEIPPDRLDQVERSLPQLRSRVANLWVETSVPDAELLVDGLSSGVLPLRAAVLVNAGVHQLQLRRPGYQTITRELTIAGNETIRLELPMQVDPVAVVGPSKEATASRVERPEPPIERERDLEGVRESRSRAPLWISMIATGVLAGGAVTFGLMARTSDERLNRELSRVPADRGRVNEMRAALQRNAAFCDGLTAGAVVAAGLSLYFLLSHPSADEGPRAATPRPKLTFAGEGLTLEHRF